MHKILIIFGPTGIGKNNLALKISKLLNNVSILNSDSRQYYKNISLCINSPLNISSLSSLHFGYSVMPLNILFNYSKFIDFSEYFIEKSINLNKIPIIVGGTGLYLNLWLNKNVYNFSIDYFIKKNINIAFNQYSNISNFLSNFEFNKIHDYRLNELFKLIRILELILINKNSYNNFFFFKKKFKNFRYIFLFLYADKNKIYNNIKKRVFSDFNFFILDQVLNYNNSFLDYFIFDKIIGINHYLKFKNNFLFFKDILNQIFFENINFIDQQEKWFKGKKDCYFLNAYSNNLIFDILKLFFFL